MRQRGAIKLRDQQEEVNSLKGYSKREISDLKNQMQRAYEEQLTRITEMVTDFLSFHLSCFWINNSYSFLTWLKLEYLCALITVLTTPC